MSIPNPMRDRVPFSVGIAAAIVAVVVATFLQVSLGPAALQAPFIFYFGAIAFAAWYGGLVPGLIATGLSTVAAAYLFFTPVNTFRFDDPTSFLRIGLFVIVAVLINLLSYTRTRAEEATRSESERLQVTLASIGDAVLAADTEGNVTFLNGIAENLTGWKQADAAGTPVQKVFHIVNEQTRAPVENPISRVVKEGVIVGLANHTVLIARDGSERPIDDSAAPIKDGSGNTIGAILVFRDVSERRRVEKEREALLGSERSAREQAEEASGRLAFLAEASQVLASSLDYQTTLSRVTRLTVPEVADWCAVDLLSEDGTLERLAVAHVDPEKVRWANEIYEKYPPPKDAPGGAYNVLRTGKPEFVANVSDEMLVQTSRTEEQLAIARELGLTSYIIVPLIARENALGVLSLVTAESRKPYGEDDVKLAEDLAGRAASAIDNARLYAEAQDAIMARDQFFSVAAHELKTPLTSLMGFAQLIQRRAQRGGELGQRDLDMLGLVGRQAQRLNRMVNSLLDVSRIQTGQLSLELRPVDVSALVRTMVEELQPTMPEHKLVLTAPDTPVMVEGDELRLEQVLFNLIQNAAKYDPEDHPVEISVEQQEDTADIKITDHGIGIPEDGMPHLFQRFYRAPNADPSRYAGMGIGLFVVREIVALHGGHVSVTSTVGDGSVFEVQLPLLVGPGIDRPAVETAGNK